MYIAYYVIRRVFLSKIDKNMNATQVPLCQTRGDICNNGTWSTKLLNILQFGSTYKAKTFTPADNTWDFNFGYNPRVLSFVSMYLFVQKCNSVDF